MFQKIPYRMTLLSLGLALVLAGATACKQGTDTEEAASAETSATEQAPTPGGPATATPGAEPSGTPPPVAGLSPEALAGAGEPAVSPDKMPEVVATVNGQDIRKDDLLKGAQLVQLRMAQGGRPVPASAALYKNVLDELIAIALLTQDAKAQGVQASDAEIQQYLNARKQNFPDEAAYKKALADNGITEAMLRAQAKEQLSVQKYVATKVTQDIQVPDQATRDFYEKNKDKITMPERVHLRHILIRTDAPGTDKQAARQKADGLLKRLQGGEDFAKLAQESSDDPGSKARGGDLSWVARGQTVPPFEQAAFALKNPNDLSPVVESQFGFHIIQLLERQAPSQIPYEQAKPRLEGMLKQQQTEQRVAAKVQELRQKAKVEVFI